MTHVKALERLLEAEAEARLEAERAQAAIYEARWRPPNIETLARCVKERKDANQRHRERVAAALNAARALVIHLKSGGTP